MDKSLLVRQCPAATFHNEQDMRTDIRIGPSGSGQSSAVGVVNTVTNFLVP